MNERSTEQTVIVDSRPKNVKLSKMDFLSHTGEGNFKLFVLSVFFDNFVLPNWNNS